MYAIMYNHCNIINMAKLQEPFRPGQDHLAELEAIQKTITGTDCPVSCIRNADMSLINYKHFIICF